MAQQDLLSAQNLLKKYQDTGASASDISAAQRGVDYWSKTDNQIITTDTLKDQSLINLGTPAKDTTPYQPIISGAGATATTPAEDPSVKLFKDYMAGETKPPSEADRYTATYGTPPTPEEIATKEATVKASTDTINTLKAQIQGIINQGTAQNLALENQGAGITAGGVQRSQQANLREIAIQVLPLESQVLVEQATLSGNVALLTQAQNKIDTYYKLQGEDAQRTYDYQKDLRDKVYNFASAEQKRLLDKQEKEQSQAITLAAQNRSDGNSWASAAVSNGQGALAGQIMALDPNDKDYQTKLGALIGQIKAKPTTGKTGGYVDTNTGKEISPYDAGKSILDANPDNSDAELFSAIKYQVPELSVTEINNLIKERPVAQVTPETAKQTIIDTLKPQKDTYTRREAKTAIENQLKSALGIKSGNLPKSYQKVVEDALVEIYGRTFWQKVLPGGR